MVARTDKFCSAFGEAVRARRLALGFSQEDLGDRAGLHRNYVGGVERGERNIGLVNASALAETLGVPLSVLIREAESLVLSRD